jgi:hypothetical protein
MSGDSTGIDQHIDSNSAFIAMEIIFTLLIAALKHRRDFSYLHIFISLSVNLLPKGNT